MKFSRFSVFLISVTLFAGLFVPIESQARERKPPRFWQEVRALVKRCSVVSQDAERLQSICASEVQTFSNGAQLRLNDRNYFAYIRDSEESDGGDLNDITVQDARGRTVAERKNVPAFGDVLLGLMGGDAAGPFISGPWIEQAK